MRKWTSSYAFSIKHGLSSVFINKVTKFKVCLKGDDQWYNPHINSVLISTISLCCYSYLSPLLKSVTTRADADYAMIGEDFEEREYFLELLESRFLFLAADARSTLRSEILLS